MSRKATQSALAVSAVSASWLSMMCIHESGHVLNAWLTAGRVQRVVLNPLTFSRTDLAHNPHPLAVAWGGPAWGAAIPVLLWASARATRTTWQLPARFFAGFCLVANGAYLGSAAVLPVGDAEDLMRLGASRWVLVTAGLAGTAGGLALWNGIGRNLAAASDSETRRSLIISATILLATALGMAAWTLWSSGGA